jgi:flavin reductase (DIM6/NTAB) family NADH-FMN oxidoreductase RutF
MLFEQKDYSPEAFYYLMLQSIIPRPIAWVLSLNSDGSHNVAPFSFFNGIAGEPPLIMIAIAWKDHATRKDTWVNIDERNDFVVHIPPSALAAQMVATSKNLPANESELSLANLQTVSVEGQKLPRLQGPKLAMFCSKHSITEVGTERIGLVMGEIKTIWVDDSAVTFDRKRALFDPVVLDPVSRLGAQHYSLLGKLLDFRRP